MSEPQNDGPESRDGEGQAEGGDPPRRRVTARRHLPPTSTRFVSETPTNPELLTGTTPAVFIKNFLRTGDHWSYDYEYGDTKLSADGTGDIPHPIIRTTDRGVERIVLNRDGVPASSTIIAPPGTEVASVYAFQGRLWKGKDASDVTLIGPFQGTITFWIDGNFVKYLNT